MKGLRKSCMVLIFCLSTFSQARAVSNFIPGYVINLSNDTIHGLIDFQEWPKNPNTICFKLSPKRTISKYNPTDILEFGVLDKRYVGAIVQKETSPYRDSELEKDPALHFESDTVFLQTLIGGEKPLYYLKDWNGKEHFYIKEDDSYSLLLHKTYVEYTANNIRNEYHNMRYIGQLTRYFWDYPSMLEKIADSYYSRSSLESLFKDFLKMNRKVGYVNKDNKVSTTFGLIAGTSVTTLVYESAYFKAGFSPSVNFTGGVSLNLAMSGVFRKWSLYNELLYSSYDTKGFIPYYFPEDGAVFDFKYLKLNAMIRFQPSWFFLNAGFSNGYCIKHYSPDFEDIRSYEIGIVFGAGVKFRKFSMEMRADIGDGMSPYVNIFTQTNRWQALLGYTF